MNWIIAIFSCILIHYWPSLPHCSTVTDLSVAFIAHLGLPHWWVMDKYLFKWIISPIQFLRLLTIPWVIVSSLLHFSLWLRLSSISLSMSDILQSSAFQLMAKALQWVSIAHWSWIPLGCLSELAVQDGSPTWFFVHVLGNKLEFILKNVLKDFFFWKNYTFLFYSHSNIYDYVSVSEDTVVYSSLI